MRMGGNWVRRKDLILNVQLNRFKIIISITGMPIKFQKTGKTEPLLQPLSQRIF